MEKERKKELLDCIEKLSEVFDKRFFYFRGRTNSRKFEALIDSNDFIINNTPKGSMDEEKFLEKKVVDLYKNYEKLEDYLPYTNSKIRELDDLAMDTFNRAEIPA